MKLEKLTPEQEALIPVIRDRWINQLYDLKELNVEQVTEGIDWLYEFCKLKKPQIFICKSILESQILVNILKNWANVRDNVMANVGDNVMANVRANVMANVRDNVRNEDFEFQTLCLYGDVNDYEWVSFYEFFTEIGILDNKDFNNFAKMLKSNYYSMIQMDKVCIIIENPSHILLNEQRQLNSVLDYAIKFKDNTGMYFVNGLYLSDSLFNKFSNKEYTFEDFCKENNEEIKSACIAFYQQKFGDEFLFRFLSENLKEIDSFIDKKNEKFMNGTTNGMNLGVYTLFKGSVNNIDIAYVRCYCPSTDRIFFLGVAPENSNAKDAIASLYRVPKLLANEIKTISRQGEKFSTTFSDNGNEILKSLTKEQVSDLVSIDGNTYFNKMTYEY